MTRIRVELRDVAALTRYDRNSKTHPQAQIDAIARSITRFGFNDPIGVWGDVIVEGEGRLLAAQQLGMTQVPVLVLPSDMTDEQVRLYRIAHNKVALSGTFDFALLVEELRSIAGSNTATFAEMGFSDDAVNNLFSMFNDGDAANLATSQHDATNAPPPALDCEVIWDTAEQRKDWNDFAARLARQHSDLTSGAALVQHLTKVMSGHVVPSVLRDEAEGSAEEEVPW